MSESKHESKDSNEMKRPTLSVKRSGNPAPKNDEGRAEDIVASTGEPQISEKSSEKKTSKGSRKDSQKPKTAEEILLSVFSEAHDKDGNVKPAKISKLDLKSLKALNTPDSLTTELNESLSKYAEKTDQTLDCVVEIALNVIDSNQDEWQQALFAFLVRLASSVWINKHKGSVDLFADIFESLDCNQEPIPVLETSLNQFYQKRITALTRPVSTISDDAEQLDGLRLSDNERGIRRALNKQQRNLVLLGVLWLINKGKCDLRVVVKYLSGKVIAGYGSKASLRDLSLLLANQWLSPEYRVVGLLTMEREQSVELAENLKRSDMLVSRKDQEIERLQQALSAKNSAMVNAIGELQRYKDEVAQLKKRAADQQLDERAARTHLRDSEGKVRARAFNLLSEEVLEPLRLSLAALQRDNPKTEVATHQIELVIESIERDLKWFKESE